MPRVVQDCEQRVRVWLWTKRYREISLKVDSFSKAKLTLSWDKLPLLSAGVEWIVWIVITIVPTYDCSC